MRDSRIGSYGAGSSHVEPAGPPVLLSSLPLAHVAQYLIAAHVLWPMDDVPLSFYLPPARAQSGDRKSMAKARVLPE